MAQAIAASSKLGRLQQEYRRVVSFQRTSAPWLPPVERRQAFDVQSSRELRKEDNVFTS